ncbi:MAG TPA: M23 family metallopeptidase [Vicinamibacteria bacterium]
MTNKVYTLIVVPHARARFRKFHVPVRTVRWAIAGMATLVLTASAFVVRAGLQVSEVWRLRAQNEELLTKAREYEQTAGAVNAKMEHLQRTIAKLGVMAGLESALPEPTAGVGGLPAAETVAPSMETGTLSAMDRSLAALTERSSRLEDFYRDQTHLLASTPSVWPVRGYLSATFGNRRDPFTGQRDFHTGIDISTPLGSKIQSPADGVVVSTAEKGGYGLTIIIEHDFGIITRYGHLQAFNVRPGQRVRRGEVIGYVGNTGRSTAPHLHYEVWVRDQAQNPIHYILDEYRSFG